MRSFFFKRYTLLSAFHDSIKATHEQLVLDEQIRAYLDISINSTQGDCGSQEVTHRKAHTKYNYQDARETRSRRVCVCGRVSSDTKFPCVLRAIYRSQSNS